MRKALIVFCTVCLGATSALIACSEAASDSLDAGSGKDSGNADTSQVGVDQITPDAKPAFDASACPNAIADAAALPVVVNEIRAKGKEFVEIFNPTNASIDLSGSKVSDVDTNGCPKSSEAIVFPANTSIPANGYIVVFSGQTDAGNAVQTACFDAGPATCYYANFGISNTTGETLFVLTSSDAIVTNGFYPPAAADSGQSWGRLPNGTGAFAVNSAPTPGSANQP